MFSEDVPPMFSEDVPNPSEIFVKEGNFKKLFDQIEILGTF